MNTLAARAHLVPNIFDPTNYFELDVRNGVLQNSFGTKCCTLSGHFLRGLHAALVEEAGPAWRLILRSCGENWGARFADRFVQEVSEFYSEDLDSMSMSRFDQLVQEYFAVCGWGRISVSYQHLPSGIIEVEVTNAIFAETLNLDESRCDVLLEGVLKALFGKATGQPLDCYETQTSSTGSPASLFLLAHEERMTGVEELIEEGKSHQQILIHVVERKLEKR